MSMRFLDLESSYFVDLESRDFVDAESPSWTSKHGGTGRYLIGRPVPGGWMRPISGSVAGGAISIGRSPPVVRPWTFTSLRSETWPQRSVS